MGRPIEIVKRDQIINIRLTRLEKKAIELMANETNLNTSDFVRKSAMNKNVHVRFSIDELNYMKSMQNYHTNFSRISNLIKNEKGINSEILKEIKEVQNQIKENLKRFDK